MSVWQFQFISNLYHKANRFGHPYWRRLGSWGRSPTPVAGLRVPQLRHCYETELGARMKSNYRVHQYRTVYEGETLWRGCKIFQLSCYARLGNHLGHDARNLSIKLNKTGRQQPRERSRQDTDLRPNDHIPKSHQISAEIYKTNETHFYIKLRCLGYDYNKTKKQLAPHGHYPNTAVWQKFRRYFAEYLKFFAISRSLHLYIPHLSNNPGREALP
jgi:hypothetical protein